MGAPIGAGGDELEFPRIVNALVEGHRAGEYTRDGARSEEKVPSGDRRHQTSGVCASRRVLSQGFLGPQPRRPSRVAVEGPQGRRAGLALHWHFHAPNRNCQTACSLPASSFGRPSVVPKCHGRIDAGRAAGRDYACGRRDGGQRRADECQSPRVVRTHAEQEAGQ